MILPAILLFLCSALAGYAYLQDGPVLSDLMLLALILGLASLILLIKSAIRPRVDRPEAQDAPHRWIVIDGSNVMHWMDNTPRIETVRAVVSELMLRGYSPGVVFDANAGYKLGGGYMGDRELGRLVGLPRDRVFVVPKGTQADPFLLASARDLGARIVTNDRFRDWAEAHPEVRDPGHLIRGGYRDGALWLDDKVRALA
jgi:Zc3h12a-like Ribonuclease NYN domain